MRLVCTLLLFVSMHAAPAQELQPGNPERANPPAALSSLVRQHRWREVSSLASEMTRNNPQDSAVFYWLGYGELELQHHIRAEQAFRTAEKLGMNNSALHEGLGLAYYRLNQFILFEREMKLAAQLDTRDPTPSYYLGLYQLTIRSDVPQALRFLDKAAELRPDDWKILY